MRKFLRLITSRALLTAILMLAQFGLITYIVFASIPNEWVYILITVAVSLVFGVYLMNVAGLHPAYKLAWMVVVLAMPIFGALAYLLLGRNGQKNRRIKRYTKHGVRLHSMLMEREKIANDLRRDDPAYARNAEYVGTGILLPAYHCNDVEYYSCGEEFFEAFKRELRKAERFIFMEYYIVEEGFLWDEVSAILREKVEQGVDVRLIYDDFGTFLTLPPLSRRAIEKSGIKTMVFNRFRPILDMSQNNRTHRKITVIDGKVGFTGGINLADAYINTTIAHGYWKDTAVCVKGRCVANFTAMILQSWSYKHEREDYDRFFPDLPEDEGENYALPFTDIPIDRENTCENLYMSTIYNAKKYVYMTTPYLLIDQEMKTALITAAHSGVDVRIIVPHVPDKHWVFWLTKAFYTELVREGVKVYEYLPGFIHAKSIVSDDTYALVGTSNMDFRSYFLQFEDGVYFRNPTLAKRIREDLDRCVSYSKQMTTENTKVSIPMRMLRSVLRVFAPLV